VSLKSARGVATLVDGGLLSNYPVTIFDRQDERLPRWPTLGVRLSSQVQGRARPPRPVQGPVALGLSLIETAIEGSQAVQSLDRCNVARSVFVDTSVVEPTDFGITDEQQEHLLSTGRRAAEDFLGDWDFAAWLRDCRGAGR
jgi:NTE family protein